MTPCAVIGAGPAVARSTPSRESYSAFGQKSVAGFAPVMSGAFAHGFAGVPVDGLSRTRAKRMMAFVLGSLQPTVATPPPLGPCAAICAAGNPARYVNGATWTAAVYVGLTFLPVTPRFRIVWVTSTQAPPGFT